MHLLLTRSRGDAPRTQAKLEAAGHSVIVSPALDIAVLDARWPGAPVDAVFATSAHAFDAFATAAEPTREARRIVPLFLVGSRTQEAARARGFLGHAVVRPSATALTAEIGSERQQWRRAVYLAGHHRKPDLEDAFKISGCGLYVIETYDARPAVDLQPHAAHALQSRRLDGALHFSQRSAMLFLDQVSKAGLDVRAIGHFCLSDEVAAPLRSAGCTVCVANAPTEAALLECVAATQA